MKKQNTPIEYEDNDPFDGTKMVGCLLIGVVILLIIFYSLRMCVNHVRHEKNVSDNSLWRNSHSVSASRCYIY